MGSCLQVVQGRDHLHSDVASRNENAVKGEGFQLFKIYEDHSTIRPKPRSSHCAVLHGNVMLIFGGVYITSGGISRTFQVVWAYNMLSNQWKAIRSVKENAPAYTAASAVLPFDDHLFIYSGTKSMATASGKCMKFHFGSGLWEDITCTGQKPLEVFGHCLAYDQQSDKVYLFGGLTAEGSCLSQFYSLNLQTDHWERMMPSDNTPTRRFYHRVVQCEDCFYIVLGGSYTRLASSKSIFRFGYGSQEWSKHECIANDGLLPEPRRAPAIAYNSRYAIMCGGVVRGDGSAPFVDDVWRLDLPRPAFFSVANSDGQMCLEPSYATWTRLPVTLKVPTSNHTAVLTENNCLCIFGGIVQMHHRGLREYRTDNCYSIYVGVATLAEMAWRILCSYFPAVKSMSSQELRAIGVPLPYAAWVTTTLDLS